jgi:putative ABC transport system permease protein
MLQDLRSALHSLLKQRAYAAIAIATLAVGVGATTSIFSFVSAVLLRPLPYPESERIVRVWEKLPNGDNNSISTLTYLDWVNENSVFDLIAAEAGSSATLTGRAEPVQLRACRVTAQYFDITGIRAAQGRTFIAGEDEPGNDRVVVVTHSVWQQYFGGDPLAVGRTIHLEGEPYTLIGVLPPNSAIDRGYWQLWRPLTFTTDSRTRDFHWLAALARLKKGVTLEAAQAQMAVIGARIARDHPGTNQGWSVNVESFAARVVWPQLRRSLYVLLGAVALVLLIVCANVANLTLARGIARERELAIRASLGAGRGRLVRLLVFESLLLSMVGGLIGLALGWVLTIAFKQALPRFSLPAEADVSFDWRVMAFGFVMFLATTCVCGLIPALQATRVDVLSSIRQGRGANRLRTRLRTALGVTEMSLAFVLLAGAGLLLRTFAKLQQIVPVHEPARVIVARLPLAEARYRAAEEFHNYLAQITDRLKSLPGVRDVALASTPPLHGVNLIMPFQVADQPIVDLPNRPDGFFKTVSASYFSVIGLHLKKGRALSPRDVKGAPPAVVINETMARKHFAGADPIGKRILIQEVLLGKRQFRPEIAWEVVGVAADEMLWRLDGKYKMPGVYVTVEQSPYEFLYVVVASTLDAKGLAPAMRKAVAAIDVDQPLTDLKTLEQAKRESLGDERLRMMLLGGFSAIALLVAMIGVYGILSYIVTQRTHELGVRFALGATPRDVLLLVLGRGAKMVAASLLIGSVGVLALTRFLSSMLFGVEAHDPATMAAVAVLLAAIGLAACIVPARRAARVDPIVALRAE